MPSPSIPLPKALPDRLQNIKAVSSEKELLLALSSPDKMVAFLNSALEDRDYCDRAEAVIQSILEELSKYYREERLDERMAASLASELYSAPSSIKALIPTDLLVDCKEGKKRVSSLLFGVASEEFHSRLRSQRANKREAIHLETKEEKGCHALLTLIQEGVSELWKIPTEELKIAATLAKKWSCDKIAFASEEALAKRFKDSALSAEEFLPYIVFSLDTGFSHLTALLVERYNAGQTGFQLKQERVGITAHFHDLGSRVTLEPFSQIAPYIRGIALEKELAKEGNLGDLLALCKDLRWLSLSDTLSLPDFSLFPKTISYLILDRVEWLEDTVFCDIVSYFPHLEGLSIRENSRLGYLSFGLIAKIGLRYLDISFIKNVSGSDILIMGAGFSRLEYLGISGLKQLSREAIRELLHAAPFLQEIDLSKSAADDTLFAEFRTHPDLQEIHAEKTAISQEKLAQWKSRAKQLRS